MPEPLSPSPSQRPPADAAQGGWQVLAVPAFQDNYLWVLHDGRQAILVDPGDAAALAACLKARDLTLAAILCTHHHADHVGGVLGLCAEFGPVPVYGPAGEAIPGRTRSVGEGEVLELAAGTFRVLEVPGHTAGHLAYLWQDRVFCGDTLFALGCGRVFEGTPAQMYASLSRLAALPGDPWIHCAHEYTLSNLAFALAADPGNAELQARGVRERARRARGEATVPSHLAEERATNPFLRAGQAALRVSAESWAGHPLGDTVDVFAALRAWKNGFRA